MEWREAISEYKSYLKLEKSLSDNTLEAYLRDLRKLEFFSDKNPIEIGKSDVEEFLYQFAKSETAIRSQARLISSLKSFFGYLQLEDWRSDNPAELLETPKLGMKLPDTLSEEEIDKLVAAIDLSLAEGERNRAIIETLYGCGLRVSELTELKLSDLFFEEDFIRVTGKGNKQRLIPISGYTVKYINLYKEHIRNHQVIQKGFEDYLFLNRRGKNLTRVMIFTIIKNLAERAGIHKKISPHTFRHSFATHLLKNGADLRSIQMMLGHESITTTEIYTHLDDKDMRNAILTYHPRSK
ncbi:site-specific tyrosine recombinase XerD [Moheibacter sediminis]|uniref:Tyrosine recombinase XerC n=1 Tax=Moheibacter sediminis TaxID=1434700 RepID=A0A1W2CP79_9FLAO|nr:site-specific tyrosine recombinase XerD [Moheibacter sediminis]SMC87019.1 integrase/recombinase XerD [Moheibacter sediminis]